MPSSAIPKKPNTLPTAVPSSCPILVRHPNTRNPSNSIQKPGAEQKGSAFGKGQLWPCPFAPPKKPKHINYCRALCCGLFGRHVQPQNVDFSCGRRQKKPRSWKNLAKSSTQQKGSAFVKGQLLPCPSAPQEKYNVNYSRAFLLCRPRPKTPPTTSSVAVPFCCALLGRQARTTQNNN